MKSFYSEYWAAEAYKKQRRADFLAGLGRSIVLLVAIGIVFACLFLSR